MIKLIIFDLDGVLVESRELHYIALNKALSEIGDQYTISKEEHLCKYDALTTTQKLKKLTAEKNLPEKYHNRIWELKQQKTLQEIDDYQRDHRIIDILKKLKSQNYKIACATNSIRDTSKLMLIRKGFFEYIDFLYSNEDVNLPKAVIFDVDGTLSKMTTRTPFEWNKVDEDEPKVEVINLVKMYKTSGYKIIIFTGRDGCCLEKSKRWLIMNGVDYDEVHIRPEGNQEKDSIIKKRLFEDNIRGKYNVELVVDDRDQVVKMWRKELGLTCLQVDYGNF